MSGWPHGERRVRRKYSTLLYLNENNFSICRNGTREIFGIYAHGELGSAGKLAQIGLRVVIKEERLFVCPIVPHVRIAIFVVNNNYGTSHARSEERRVGKEC